MASDAAHLQAVVDEWSSDEGNIDPSSWSQRVTRSTRGTNGGTLRGVWNVPVSTSQVARSNSSVAASPDTSPPSTRVACERHLRPATATPCPMCGTWTHPDSRAAHNSSGKCSVLLGWVCVGSWTGMSTLGRSSGVCYTPCHRGE